MKETIEIDLGSLLEKSQRLIEQATSEERRRCLDIVEGHLMRNVRNAILSDELASVAAEIDPRKRANEEMRRCATLGSPAEHTAVIRALYGGR